MARTFEHLVDHVFGPYPDHIFLNPRKPGELLQLEDIEIYCDSQRIGFDQSEYINQPPKGSLLTSRSTVYFFGVLELANVDLLSEKGRKLLERDLKEHDVSKRIQYALNPRWDLSEIDRRVKKAEGRPLRVRLGCNKMMLAHYMTSDVHFEKFIIYSGSELQYRPYWVKSLNVQTLKRSLKFIARFRIRALIVELCETDPAKTPVAQRDIEFLIKRYLTEMVPRDREGERRLIQAEDLDLSTASETRHLRHISRAEIRSLFAEHAEWLLANQMGSSKGHGGNVIINIAKWKDFCEEAWYDSLEAKRHNERWGISEDVSLVKFATFDSAKNRELAARLAQYGEDQETWAHKLDTLANRIERIRRDATNQDSTSTLEKITTSGPGKPTVFYYDEDFSEATTDESSDSEEALPATLRNRIPKFAFEYPRIKSGHFTWNCPGCKHIIDLLDLPAEYLELLPPETAHILKHTTNWTITAGPVKNALYTMVAHHYKVYHFAPRNIHLSIRPNGKVYINEENRMDLGDDREAVKTEEFVT